MERLEFRKLREDEIDCRIATVNEKGLSLLLYKDARVDQNILDETVGPMNWQRHHSRDNANCTVAIWDAEKKQWIEKEDTGTESNTEKEKGLASDSFKRACFNWGIGRELYTAPFIWISADACRITDSGRKNNGKQVFTSNDKFCVSRIGYENGNISLLEIKNSKSRKIVYSFGCSPELCEYAPPIKETEKQPEMLDEKYVNSLRKELARTGVGRNSLLAQYQVKDIPYLTFEQYKEAMGILAKKPDKESLIDQADASGLPWNTQSR